MASVSHIKERTHLDDIESCGHGDSRVGRITPSTENRQTRLGGQRLRAAYYALGA